MEKSKRLLLVFMAVLMFLTSCKPITQEEKVKVDGEGHKQEEVVYDTIENMNFSGAYVEGILRENFSVKATLPEEVPKVMGNYEMSAVWRDNYDIDGSQYLAELVDAYYGEGVSVTLSETEDYEMVNTTYIGYSGSYRSSKLLPSDNYGRIEKIRESLPEYGQYDEKFITPIVEEFLEKMSPIVPDGVNGEYACVHFDEEYKSYINEKYENESPYKYEWSTPLSIEDYYIVRLETQIEGVGFKNLSNRIGYDSVDGYTYDSVFQVIGADEKYDIGGAVMSMPQYLDIYIDSNGEVFMFDFCHAFNVEEKIEDKAILSWKEILEIVYGYYEDMILKYEMMVTEMNLHYMMVLGEPDENDYVNGYLTPVWEVYLYDTFEKGYIQYIYSAHTGELLKTNIGVNYYD